MLYANKGFSRPRHLKGKECNSWPTLAKLWPEYCLLFLIPNYNNILVFFLFALFSGEPEVFLPKYSQTAIPHAPPRATLEPQNGTRSF